ncbi:MULTISPECIES: DUF1905 domain-containing protein [unclassified Salinibacterium]|uniref:DUF1905 domain-containing protein n=1 Tax=unclassified Salinibacterium TaxID=2632331 RepID=UPI001423299A|nr:MULTISPECIES: DUF1905 domain-containing protein [unclassified Salinibacterium]
MHYVFEAELWRWNARRNDIWTFVSVPAEQAAEITQVVEGLTSGFGSVRVDVRIGETRWRTSIFPTKSDGTYALPIKKAVRAAEAIEPGQVVTVELELVDF